MNSSSNSLNSLNGLFKEIYLDALVFGQSQGFLTWQDRDKLHNLQKQFGPAYIYKNKRYYLIKGQFLDTKQYKTTKFESDLIKVLDG